MFFHFYFNLVIKGMVIYDSYFIFFYFIHIVSHAYNHIIIIRIFWFKRQKNVSFENLQKLVKGDKHRGYLGNYIELAWSKSKAQRTAL